MATTRTSKSRRTAAPTLITIPSVRLYGAWREPFAELVKAGSPYPAIGTICSGCSVRLQNHEPIFAFQVTEKLGGFKPLLITKYFHPQCVSTGTYHSPEALATTPAAQSRDGNVLPTVSTDPPSVDWSREPIDEREQAIRKRLLDASLPLSLTIMRNDVLARGGAPASDLVRAHQEKQVIQQKARISRNERHIAEAIEAIDRPNLPQECDVATEKPLGPLVATLLHEVVCSRLRTATIKMLLEIGPYTEESYSEAFDRLVSLDF